jgi:F0F1-type ATP synthase membrane subunit b/b'
MSAVSLIPSLQSDALVRDIEQQFKDENAAIAADAKRAAQSILAQTRAVVRAQVHEAIAELREEGRRRLIRAKAQFATQKRAREQRRAAEAVSNALPLLQEALLARWKDPEARRQWTDAVARQCGVRLRRDAWVVDHPAGWNKKEQEQLLAALGDVPDVTFKADKAIACGLRVTADGAVLDATPLGLLADATAVAALLLEELGANGS